ncbi:MAG: phosphate/phosphite/phosphonate ABC transporter substrate-binding protein [Sulfuritalea sp.]|nr:phosphate/phosphite/phosphonate ABC transporter substrate-binding protein [Sulfuritalea sp.]
MARFKYFRSFVPLLAMLAMALLAGACGKRDENAYQPVLGQANPLQATEYVVGIHPLHNPQRLMEVYGPIVDVMNSSIPDARFKLEASRNYEEFEKKLYAGHFAFAMPNPYQTLLSLRHGYRVFGKMAEDEVFRGIILVRKDSGIRAVTDLKGKAVSYPAATALAATMMPQYYLHTHGVDINRDIENRYVGSQESSILNVLRGHVAAGATWPVPWKTFVAEHPDMASQLEVKWETEPLLNNGWVVREDVPAPLADKFAGVLFGLHKSAAGKLMLSALPIVSFEAASDETYRPVGIFLEKFSRTVRPIDH